MQTNLDILEKAQELSRQGNYLEALRTLRDSLDADVGPSILSRVAKLLKSFPDEDVAVVRVAFLGGGALEYLVEFTSVWLRLRGFRLESYLPAFDTWRMDVLNADSGLYRFNPDVIWFFSNWRDVITTNIPPRSSFSEADQAAQSLAAELCNYWHVAAKYAPGAKIVQNNLDPTPHNSLGNMAAMLPGSQVFLVELLNGKLAAAASDNGVTLFAFHRLTVECGLRRWHDSKYWYYAKLPFSLQVTGMVSFHVASLLAPLMGRMRKVLALDLDGTLWGGVIGDDGLDGIALGDGPDGEAFTGFQGYLKELSERGIILAVVSKNEETVAKQPFLEHPDMRLRLDDIAVFKANWKNKADNIRDVADILNVGLDSFVFLDDNPAERELVRKELPMVAVPELPTDPSEYIATLEKHGCFEAVSLSQEDLARNRMYRENALRVTARHSVTNVADYLSGLRMEGASGSADAFHLPRMAQLLARSNQFHLTTTRYSSDEMARMAARDDYNVRWFSLRDHFGDYGLVAVVILQLRGQDCIIDTWSMSCRVLERGMEDFILNELVDWARRRGSKRLIGLYKPTAKNVLVKGLYDRLGFTGLQGEFASWEYDLSKAAPARQTFITRLE